MSYRKDVQILRGIAVLLVVLFHLGVPGFGSGFLGVDVFFVISGYLMAVMYDPAQKIEFFSKRAKRLLPAYFVTILITLLFGLLNTTPNEFGQISTQAWFASAFISNIGFWLENSYFDKAAFKPLLHLWSLGVEIQFYALVPVLFWTLRKTGPAGYVIIGVGSALLCFLIIGVSSKTSFFWMPLRLWEFLLGFGAAKYLSRAGGGVVPRSTWVGALCLGLIFLIPLFPVDGTAPNFLFGHPGLAALAIAGATASVLLFGVPRRIESSRAMSALERIGNWSYSIYLAHFPVIVLYLYQPFAGTALKTTGVAQPLLMGALVVIAAALLFRLVEMPFRHGLPLRRPIVGAAVAIMGLAAFGGSLQTLTLPKQEQQIYEAWTDRAEYRCGKLNRLLDPRSTACETTPPHHAPSARILLVGNSHADSIKRTFSEAASAQRASVYFLVENGPLMKGGITAVGLMNEAVRRKVDAIVLHYSEGAISPVTVRELVELAKQNSIQVSFIMPVPTWDRHVPQMLRDHLKNGRALSVRNKSDYIATNEALIVGLENIQYSNFRLYPLVDIFCRETCQLTATGGKLLYFDAGHLTLTGSGMLRQQFDTIVEDARRGAHPGSKS